MIVIGKAGLRIGQIHAALQVAVLVVVVGLAEFLLVHIRRGHVDITRVIVVADEKLNITIRLGSLGGAAYKLPVVDRGVELRRRMIQPVFIAVQEKQIELVDGVSRGRSAGFAVAIRRNGSGFRPAAERVHITRFAVYRYDGVRADILKRDACHFYGVPALWYARAAPHTPGTAPIGTPVLKIGVFQQVEAIGVLRFFELEIVKPDGADTGFIDEADENAGGVSLWNERGDPNALPFVNACGGDALRAGPSGVGPCAGFGLDIHHDAPATDTGASRVHIGGEGVEAGGQVFDVLSQPNLPRIGGRLGELGGLLANVALVAVNGYGIAVGRRFVGGKIRGVPVKGWVDGQVCHALLGFRCRQQLVVLAVKFVRRSILVRLPLPGHVVHHAHCLPGVVELVGHVVPGVAGDGGRVVLVGEGILGVDRRARAVGDGGHPLRAAARVGDGGDRVIRLVGDFCQQRAAVGHLHHRAVGIGDFNQIVPVAVIGGLPVAAIFDMGQPGAVVEKGVIPSRAVVDGVDTILRVIGHAYEVPVCVVDRRQLAAGPKLHFSPVLVGDDVFGVAGAGVRQGVTQPVLILAGGGCVAVGVLEVEIMLGSVGVEEIVFVTPRKHLARCLFDRHVKIGAPIGSAIADVGAAGIVYVGNGHRHAGAVVADVILSHDQIAVEVVDSHRAPPRRQGRVRPIILHALGVAVGDLKDCAGTLGKARAVPGTVMNIRSASVL